MIVLLIVLMILAVAGFAVWSMLVMSPVLTICTLVSFSVLMYLIDRDLKRC